MTISAFGIEVANGFRIKNTIGRDLGGLRCWNLVSGLMIGLCSTSMEVYRWMCTGNSGAG